VWRDPNAQISIAQTHKFGVATSDEDPPIKLWTAVRRVSPREAAVPRRGIVCVRAMAVWTANAARRAPGR
jgi:hypothetical protein